MKTTDSRINDLLSFGEYIELMDEYLGEIERKSSGEYMMSDTECRCVSYPREKSEKKLTVIINYKEQSIEIF